MFFPHSSVQKPRIPSPAAPTPPKSRVLSECVPRCKINPPSRRPVGLFGFPAAAMILNNAIAKLVLGWEKSPGAGRPRLDLAEGAFNPAAGGNRAGPAGVWGGAGCAPEVLASPPGQGRRWAAAGRGRGSAATCFPALRGHAFLPLASALAPRYPPPRPPLATSRGPRWETRIEPRSRSTPPPPHPRRLPVVPGVGLLGQQSRSPRELGRWVGGVGVGNPIRDLSVPGQVAAPGAARSPRRASLPSPLPALHLPHPRRAPGALPLSFAESFLRQSYKRCFHRWFFQVAVSGWEKQRNGYRMG